MALKDPTMRGTPVLSALAVASTLALAACGEATESGSTDASTSATTTATTEADREISADHDDTDIVFAQMWSPITSRRERGRITTILLLHFADLPGMAG